MWVGKGGNNSRNKQAKPPKMVAFYIMYKLVLFFKRVQLGYFIYTKKIKRTLKISEQVIKRYPDSVIGYYAKSVALLQSQSFKRAILMFEETICMINKIGNSQDKVLYLSDSYSKMGRAYYELQNYEKAILHYDKSIDIDPDSDWHAYFYRASAKFKKQLYQEALDDFYKVLDFKKYQQETLENIRVVKERMSE